MVPMLFGIHYLAAGESPSPLDQPHSSLIESGTDLMIGCHDNVIRFLSDSACRS